MAAPLALQEGFPYAVRVAPSLTPAALAIIALADFGKIRTSSIVEVSDPINFLAD